MSEPVMGIPVMGIGMTFEVGMRLPIGKDGRYVRRTVTATVVGEVPKRYRIRYHWQGLTTEGAPVEVTGSTQLPRETVRRLRGLAE